jgi:hypothetical protein
MIPEYGLSHPFVPCAALIFLDAGHRSNTYCLRALGHADEGVKGFPGGHNVVDAPPEEKKES